MDFKHRAVALEVVDIPALQANAPLSTEEKTYLKSFSDANDMSEEVIFLQPHTGSMFKKYKVSDKQSMSILKAAKAAGINVVPAIIGEEFSYSFINLFRRKASENKRSDTDNHDILEEAIKTYRALKESSLPAKGKKAIARFGSKDTVYEKVRLARDLPTEVQKLVKNGELSKSAARVISYFRGSGIYRSKLELARATIENKYSVRNLEAIVYNEAPLLSENESKFIFKFQEELGEQIGHTVKLKPKSNSREQGKVVIDFYSTEELLWFLKALEYCESKTNFSVTAVNHSFKSTPGKIQISYKSLSHLSEIRKSLSEKLM